MQLNEIRAFEAVIASQIDGGVFAAIDLSEAIQLFYEKDWIASSHRLLEGEQPRPRRRGSGFSKTKTWAPRNDKLERLISLNPFPASL